MLRDSEDLVPVAIGHLDVTDDKVESIAVHRGGLERFDRNATIVAGRHNGTPVPKHIGDNAPDLGRIVRDEDSLSDQGRVRLAFAKGALDAKQRLWTRGDIADACLDRVDVILDLGDVLCERRVLSSHIVEAFCFSQNVVERVVEFARDTP